jgi:hypothetical protein
MLKFSDLFEFLGFSSPMDEIVDAGDAWSGDNLSGAFFRLGVELNPGEKAMSVFGGSKSSFRTADTFLGSRYLNPNDKPRRE